VAQAFAAVLDAPEPVVHNQAFNVGADALNIRVADLAETVATVVPECRLEVAGSPLADRRSYRADFRKFAAAFPHVAFRPPEAGARDLHEAFTRVALTREQYRDGRFTRLAWLRQLLDRGVLDDSLRRRAEVEVA
jgi:hypothetical protein